jgi:transporter family-2 protein
LPVSQLVYDTVWRTKLIELVLVMAIGMAGGFAVGTQAPIAAAMAQRVGGASSSFIVHIGGTIASLILLVFRGGEQITQWRELSWYMLGCGALGAMLFLSFSYTIPRIGATGARALLMVGQLSAAMMIDHFGLFEVTVRTIDPGRILAIGLLFTGAYLMIR